MIKEFKLWFLYAPLSMALNLWSPTEAVAQSYILKGLVVEAEESSAVPNSYIINSKTYAGTVSNGIGYFELQVAKGDTLVISNIGYQFKYVSIDEELIQNIKEEQLFVLEPRNFLLDEVSIYAITSNNPKSMPMNEPRVPKNENVRLPKSVAPTMANPLDLLYYSFGKRPKQLAALRELQRADAYRQKLEEGNNREIIEQLTGIPKAEMEAFMFYCKYSDSEVRTLNDYQFLVSLLDCYEYYKREEEQTQAEETLQK